MIRTFFLAAVLLGLAAAPLAAQQQSAPDAGGAPANAAPRTVPPQAFGTPEEGFAAFAAAVRAHDQRRLLAVLGSGGRRLINSGDPAADRQQREAFTAAYAARQAIVRPAPDRAVLEVGEDHWPLPLPMAMRDGRWRFDVAAGAQELVDRRIGRNELDAIETLRAIVDAQEEYAAGVGRQGAMRAFAQRFFSTPGLRNGLYWPTMADEPASPLGPFLAAAGAPAGGGQARGDTPQPFHGYFFRILTRQGPAAPGGAIDYVVGGQMIGGFAVIAWPARYGSTGWKTFMVSHRGDVWEAHLGPRSAQTARAMIAFDPVSPPWSRLAD